VMCEDAAQTVYLARQLGDPPRLTGTQVDALHNRYVQEYGQVPRAQIAPAGSEIGALSKPASRSC
jgi:hypothetical protein